MDRFYALLLVLTAFSFQLVLAQEVPVDSSYANSHYRERLEYFKQMPGLKREIVFLGNSITEAGPWQELTAKKNVLNRGISGDVSYGVVQRLDEVLSSHPAKVFLLIGINDLKRGTPVDYIAANYRRIVKTFSVQSPKTKLYLQSVLPVAENMLNPAYAKISNKIVRELNSELLKVAEEYQLPYVDLYTDVFADSSGQMKPELTTDGIHLKPPAYILWVDYLKKKNFL